MTKPNRPRYYHITTLIITCLLVITGIVAYNKYLKPFYQNHSLEVVEFDLIQDTTLTFVKPADRGNVFAIELEIYGHSKENLGFVIGDGHLPRNTAIIKKGEIDFAYLNDWYADTIELEISTEKNSGAHLRIEYAFQCLK